MRTGPVTILNGSSARDHQPRAAFCRQLALAISEEVLDLEHAGVRAPRSPRRRCARACRCASRNGAIVSTGSSSPSASAPFSMRSSGADPEVNQAAVGAFPPPVRPLKVKPDRSDQRS
nr:hypothetical protein [Thiorhodococcus minor]